MWRGVRVVEGARLESVYTLIAYRGFDKFVGTNLVAGAKRERPQGQNQDGFEQSLSLRTQRVLKKVRLDLLFATNR